MKRTCDNITLKGMVMPTCEFHTIIKKISNIV